MASALMSTLASLRGKISRLETETVAQDAQRGAGAYRPRRPQLIFGST